jgi:hypothetical protein
MRFVTAFAALAAALLPAAAGAEDLIEPTPQESRRHRTLDSAELLPHEQLLPQGA